jgi:PIN domain nuclease of toxin-antitoxin system
MLSSDCVVSVASLWQVAIKHRLVNSVVAPAPFCDQSLLSGAVLLPVLDSHVIETAQLKLVHQDHFDLPMGTGLVTRCRCIAYEGLPPQPAGDADPLIMC